MKHFVVTQVALNTMRDRGKEWWAYENQEIGNPLGGHLQFLQCGEGCAYREPPQRLPDTSTAINWRYWRVGKVNLTTGEVELKALDDHNSPLP